MKEIMQIFPASAKTIRSWSHGEVKNPETINCRSLKPEKGGLYCERIFGPTKDWECTCGKYKKVKYKGIICERCGVEVTSSKVRRERMGHIELAVPVVHPWYLHRNKILADLLGIANDKLIKVVYYDAHIILEIKDWEYDWDFYPEQVIDDHEYSLANSKYGSRLSAGQGGKAILFLLQNMDLEAELKIAQKVLHDYPPKDNKSLLKLQNKIKAIKFFLENQLNPADLVLTVLPVIPADLRPLIPLDNGRFASNDFNDLYRRVINRNNRLKNLLKLNASEVIICNEKRALQEAVDALIENGLHGEPVTGALNRPLESLTHHLGTGREWRRKKRFAQIKAGKIVDYSAETVAVPDSDLPDNIVLIPYKIAKNLFEPFLISELKRREIAHTAKGAKKIIDDEHIVFCILEYLVEEFAVFVTHPPVVNNLRARFFKVGLTRDYALHLSINSFYDMEFDHPSSQAKIFLPLSNKAQYEAQYLVNHPLRLKRRKRDAHIILKMLECDFSQKPLLCPSFEYAAALSELNHLSVNTHIQLPKQIHTSIGGALLAMEFPDILSPESYPETVDTAENFLTEKIMSPKFKQLLVKYSYLLDDEKPYSSEKIFKEEYIRTYDSGLIGFQKKKFAELLPAKSLNLESVYFSAFANLAYCTYCKNESHNECLVKECPAHGLSGKEKCLFLSFDGKLPDYGSAIGINAVYKILEIFSETDMKSAVQMLHQVLMSKDVLRFTSMENLENVFHFPQKFPRKEIELLFAIRKQQQQCDYGTGNFFYDAARNAPNTILHAMFTGRKIDLMTPDAVIFSGNKPETCAIESAMKDVMDNAKFFLPDSIVDEPDDSDEKFLLDFDKDEDFDNSEEDSFTWL